MSSVHEKQKTYADYEKLPEGAPIQLINGMFVESPAPTPYHQSIVGYFYSLFLPLQSAGKGKVFFSPIDVYLKETETYQPDVIFIGTEKANIIGDRKIEGPPDIVVETLSPSTAYYDLRHKMRKYEESGVGEYWIVDPMDKVIEVYVNGEHGFELKEKAEGQGTACSQLFPEVKADCEDVFRMW